MLPNAQAKGPVDGGVKPPSATIHMERLALSPSTSGDRVPRSVVSCVDIRVPTIATLQSMNESNRFRVNSDVSLGANTQNDLEIAEKEIKELKIQLAQETQQRKERSDEIEALKMQLKKKDQKRIWEVVELREQGFMERTAKNAEISVLEKRLEDKINEFSEKCSEISVLQSHLENRDEKLYAQRFEIQMLMARMVGKDITTTLQNSTINSNPPTKTPESSTNTRISTIFNLTHQNTHLRDMSTKLVKRIQDYETGIMVGLMFEPGQKASYKRIFNTPEFAPWLQRRLEDCRQHEVDFLKVLWDVPRAMRSEIHIWKCKYAPQTVQNPKRGEETWRFWLKSSAQECDDAYVQGYEEGTEEHKAKIKELEETVRDLRERAEKDLEIGSSE